MWPGGAFGKPSHVQLVIDIDDDEPLSVLLEPPTKVRRTTGECSGVLAFPVRSGTHDPTEIADSVPLASNRESTSAFADTIRGRMCAPRQQEGARSGCASGVARAEHPSTPRQVTNTVGPPVLDRALKSLFSGCGTRIRSVTGQTPCSAIPTATGDITSGKGKSKDKSKGVGKGKFQVKGVGKGKVQVKGGKVQVKGKCGADTSPPGYVHDNLRVGLVEDLMQRLRFRANVIRMGKTRGKWTQPTVLLRDVEAVVETPGMPRAKTDHVWLKVGKQLSELHLRAGDVVEFDARVRWYRKKGGCDLRLSHHTKLTKLPAGELGKVQVQVFNQHRGKKRSSFAVRSRLCGGSASEHLKKP